MSDKIGDVMRTTMENLKEMVDVNTVVGTPVQTGGGAMVVPVSKVSFGFVSGGGEYGAGKQPPQQLPAPLPFSGGAGAGVTVSPVGFLVVGPDGVRMVSAQVDTYLDRIIEGLPALIDQVRRCFDEPCQQAAPQSEPPAPEEIYTL